MVRWLLLLLLLSAWSPATAQSPAEKVALRQAVERGELLFELDRAAWVTTDDMLQRFGGRRDMPIKGWVVERDAADGYRVTYFGDGAAGPVAWYAGRVRGGKVVAGEVYPEAARPALTAAQVRLKQAADTARGFTDYQPCTRSRFNVAVVPPASPDAPAETYLLSAQTEASVYPLGGHYLLRIGPDGKILSHRRFMNSCMNVDAARPGPRGAPAALFLTHLLDPLPTEIHVWASLAMGKPIFVATGPPARLWSVEGRRIRPLKK